MEQQNQQPVTVTLGDIAGMVQIIDVVSRRGAVQGNELAAVGMLRNKLEEFLRQNNPQEGEADPSNEVDVELPLQGDLANKVVG